MSTENMVIWNVRELSARVRRDVVHHLVAQEQISLVTLQETKLDVCTDVLIRELFGVDFDYYALPAIHTCGGILLAWKKGTWSVSNLLLRAYSLTAKVKLLSSGQESWITCVYGPQVDGDKLNFLSELRDLRAGCTGTWMICGNFNLIYKAEDKNNSRLNRRMMSRFRRLQDDLELQELNLHGRLFTWSNERTDPTLERIDRAFVSQDWITEFPDHYLQALSSQCSDHAPLLLQTSCPLNSFRRFRFENIWPKYDGYLQTVQQAWQCPWSQADAFCTLDYKLRNTAVALKRWSAKHMGSVRLQLAIAQEIVYRLDQAQDQRTLAPHEQNLRNKMKMKCLGLASMLRTIMRQPSWITYLAEGDANTKFFHMQACNRNRKNFIHALSVDNLEVFHEEAKANLIFQHYNALLGTPTSPSISLDFQRLNILSTDMNSTDYCFSEEEVWKTIQELPIDKASGPDGFTGMFYRTAWPIIKQDSARAY